MEEHDSNTKQIDSLLRQSGGDTRLSTMFKQYQRPQLYLDKYSSFMHIYSGLGALEGRCGST